MPKGFKNQLGFFPEYAQLFNYTEHTSSSYKERTWENVQNSDGTLRLAFDFESLGEKCTLSAIRKYKKPYWDVNLKNSKDYLIATVDWIDRWNIKVLNIAGNSNKTNCYTEIAAAFFLDRLFTLLKGGK